METEMKMKTKTEFYYLCHPLTGKTEDGIQENIKKNAALARSLAEKYPDRIIFSPIAANSFMKEPKDRELGLRYCMAYLRSGIFTGIILPFPEWIKSEGCRMEFIEAFNRHMVIEYIDSETGEVYQLNG